jgi:hypothetical protein
MFKSFDPRSHVALKPGATHALIKPIVQRAADNKTSTRRQKRAFPHEEWALRRGKAVYVMIFSPFD